MDAAEPVHLASLASRLVPPSSEPLNLTLFAGERLEQLRRGLTGGSQFAQDRWVDHWLNATRGGLVIESGAFGPELFSNSLFLEVARGWRCLLVEPTPEFQGNILAAHRRCHLLRGGLSPVHGRASFDLIVGQGALNGLTETVNTVQRAAEHVTVPCFPVSQILQTAGLGATVDYWSLDTEGSELPILNHTKFGLAHGGIEVGVLAVEHSSAVKRRQVAELLHAKGLRRVSCQDTDDFFVDPSYFERRGLPLPSSASVPSFDPRLSVIPEVRKGRWRHGPCPRDGLAS